MGSRGQKLVRPIEGGGEAKLEAKGFEVEIYENPAQKMMKEMNLANPVSTNKEQEVDILSHSVNPVRLKNNPVKLDESCIRNLYLDIIS